ncbi:MAG: hypothetical protein AMXMBFR13_20840 [Phycisphaerae bacterium]
MTADQRGPERELEDALHRLRPASFAPDWSDVRIRAAQRTARRSLWTWRALSAALAAGLAVSLALPRAPGVADSPTVVEIRQPPVAPPEVRPAPGPGSYAVLRARVEQGGLESLPVHRAPQSTGPRLEDWPSLAL